MATTTAHVPVFDSTLQLTHQWLQDVQSEAGLRDQPQAYSVLRAVLHALRDRLTPDEAADLGAQLPMLVRGFYYEGWKPAKTPLKQRSKQEFLDAIPPLLNPDDRIDAEEAVRSVFAVLAARVTEGEIEDVRHMLPREMATLWPSA